MSVKLDWQIETEHVVERAGEDPEERRRRRARRARIILTVAVFALVLGGALTLVTLRLSAVDGRLRQDLLDVIQTEATTIRMGDRVGFLSVQRSASEFWIKTQSERFSRYQDLKTSAGLEVTGNVLDMTIDGQRGRALIEQKMNGQAYYTVWFYWRYADGWRHVPSDYTFWGDEQTLSTPNVIVTYHDLDAKLAQALIDRADKWWTSGCANLGCDNKTLKPLRIQILANPSLRLRWDDIQDAADGSQNHENRLTIPSPLATNENIAADVDVPTALEDEIAVAIAERQFSIASKGLVPLNVADAAWLRQAIIQWTARSFTGRGDAAQVSFIQSLFGNYGPQALGALVRSLRPTSSIRVISEALQLPVESLSLDWRTFFQWRLDVEKTLLGMNNQAAFVDLWDTANSQAYALMQRRMAAPTQATGQVQAVAIAQGPDGLPRATVQITINNEVSVIYFRLVDGEWKRTA